SVNNGAGTTTTNGMIPSQCELATGGGYGGCSIYGSLEYLLWKMGPTFHSEGMDRLPAFRLDMPYIYGTRSVIISNTVQPSSITTNRSIFLFGTARLDPVIFDGTNLDSADRNGFRLTVGGYLDAAREVGLEGRFFELERHGSTVRGVASTAIPVTNG